MCISWDFYCSAAEVVTFLPRQIEQWLCALQGIELHNPNAAAADADMKSDTESYFSEYSGTHSLAAVTLAPCVSLCPVPDNCALRVLPLTGALCSWSRLPQPCGLRQCNAAQEELKWAVQRRWECSNGCVNACMSGGVAGC
jgi:hypothetical protein